MGDADIEMGDVEPSAPWLPYGIPYPPPLPDKLKFNGQSNEEDPDWEKWAAYFGARDDLWGEGFEIRLLNFGDPTGKGKFLADDWDVQYMLGRPGDSRRWNPIITKWGLQVLDKAGFINLDLATHGALGGPKGRFFDKRPLGWGKDLIHPVFRKDMWQKITDSEYDVLRPALWLASAFLDDPTTLCLFHALSTPSDHITFEDLKLKSCRRLQVPGTLTEAEQLSTFQKICDMRQWTSFYLVDTADLAVEKALAVTFPLQALASGPSTRQSRIAVPRLSCEALMLYLNKDKTSDYHDFFKSVLQNTGVQGSRKPEGFENNLDSAFLRTILLFTTSLVHEFAHAFCMAYFARSDPESPREPWVGDSRDNEFGHAMVRHIIGGLPYANLCHGIKEDPWKQYWQVCAYAPFGIYFTEKFNQWAMFGDAKKQHLVEGSGEDFMSPIVCYPLAQRQVYNYLTDELWREEVSRYGLDALKLTKIPAWAASKWPGPDPSNPSYQSTLR